MNFEGEMAQVRFILGTPENDFKRSKLYLLAKELGRTVPAAQIRFEMIKLSLAGHTSEEIVKILQTVMKIGSTSRPSPEEISDVIRSFSRRHTGPIPLVDENES